MSLRLENGILVHDFAYVIAHSGVDESLSEPHTQHYQAAHGQQIGNDRFSTVRVLRLDTTTISALWARAHQLSLAARAHKQRKEIEPLMNDWLQWH